MIPKEEFIGLLEGLSESQRQLLRSLALRSLHDSLQGFDLFTGVWWPLRARSPAAPQRETSWIVAKLHAAYPIPHVRPDNGSGPSLGSILGRLEPRDEQEKRRFRRRFEHVIASPFEHLEPQLRWALAQVAQALKKTTHTSSPLQGIDWERLLDDLSNWSSTRQQRGKLNVREQWAEDYLKESKKRDYHARREPC